MPEAKVTIKVRVGQGLLQRLRAVSRAVDADPGEFIATAIEDALRLQEAVQRREAATFDTLEERLLAEGQSMSFHVSGEPDDEAECELCMRPVLRGTRVEGPLLCDDCYALAKGNGVSAPAAP